MIPLPVALCLSALVEAAPAQPVTQQTANDVQEVMRLDQRTDPHPRGSSPFAGATLNVEPNPPIYGRAVELMLVVPNRDVRPRQLLVTADLQGVLFVSGSDGAHVPGGDTIARSSSTIRWPVLVLPPRSRGTLRVRGVMRSELMQLTASFIVAGGSWRDREEFEAVAATIQVEPRSQERQVTPAAWARWIALMLSGPLVAGLLALPAVRFMWRRRRPKPPRTRSPYGAGIFVTLLIASLLGSYVSIAAYHDVRLYAFFRKTTCRVTDRILHGQTVRSSAGTSPTMFRPVVALLVSTETGVVPAVSGDGDAGRTHLEDYADARAKALGYEPGRSYNCWYLPEDPSDVVLRRSIDWSTLLVLAPLLMLFVVGKFLTLGDRMETRPTGAWRRAEKELFGRDQDSS